MKILLDESGSASIWAIISLSFSMLIASFLFYRVNKVKKLCTILINKIENKNVFQEEK